MLLVDDTRETLTIGYIITRFDEYGGAQVHVRDLALAAKEQGYNVTILTGSLGVASQEAVELGLDVVQVPELVREISPAKDVAAVLTIAKMIKKRKIMLLHCHSSKAGIIGRLAARKARIPAIFTAHGWAFTDGVSPTKKLIYRAIEKLMAPLASRIITVSEYDRDLGLRSGISKEPHMVAIQNGMPNTPILSRELRNMSDPIKLIMVARIAQPKNQALLMHALSDIKSDRWTLTIVGGGCDSELRSIASTCGIQDKVTFLGQRRDVPELLASHDVFCLISKWEGFPLTIVEAMRSGMPVIASDVGGCKEAIENGVSGSLVPRDGRNEIGDAVRKLISDPSLVASQGAAGRAIYEARLTFEDMSAKTFAIYESVISKYR